MTSIELQRLENIKHNQKLLKDLNLSGLLPHVNSEKKPAAKRRKVENAPLRTSARIASSAKFIHHEDVEKDHQKSKRVPAKRNVAKGDIRHTIIPRSDVESLRFSWKEWKCTAPQPTRDESGTFHFESHPSFIPNKSPEEAIREGCFGGSYFRPLMSQKLGIMIEDDYKELPPSWIDGLDIYRYIASPTYNPDVNKFKVACGQSIEEWEAAGWINHDYDVRGWFQWYTRFFQGRRCEDDDRQVSRWRKCVGDSGRWRRMLLKKYVALGVREVFDDGADEDTPEVSPVMHQTCHHWAFEVRQNVLDDYWSSGK
jgi:hypothetical protein